MNLFSTFLIYDTGIQERYCLLFKLFAKEDIDGIYSKVKAILDENRVANGVLRNTADYWARDYLPLQKDPGQFVGFVYYLDYLFGKEKYITDYHQVTFPLKVDKEVKDLNLIIDGGNVVVAGDGKVIMIEKVFCENRMLKRDQIHSMLEDAFQTEVIILPWDMKNDEYGHTDGVIRGVDRNTVLASFQGCEDIYANEMRRILNTHYNLVELEFEDPHLDGWAYVNSLVTDKVIIIPALGIEDDAKVMEVYKKLFTSYGERIYMFEMADFVGNQQVGGGALNCLTWTVRRSEEE